MSASPTKHDGRATHDRRSRGVALATVGPRDLGGTEVLMRPARLADGVAWRAARLPEEARLSPAFGTPGETWEESCNMTSWVEHVLAQRRASRAGTLVPFLVLTTGGDVLGECTFTVDLRSGAAECSLWTSRTASVEVTTWATLSATLRMLELASQVPFVVAPIAVPNPGPGRLLALAGYQQVAVSRALRLYDGVPTDHTVWQLENTPASRAHLRDLLA